MDIFFTIVSNLFTPFNLFLTFGGAFFGILVGAMPGLSSVMGLSIMLPFAIRIGGVGSILMLLGIYCGAVYGGSITAILINTIFSDRRSPFCCCTSFHCAAIVEIRTQVRAHGVFCTWNFRT